MIFWSYFPFIVLLVIVLVIDIVQYNCDSFKCTVFNHSMKHPRDLDKYTGMLNKLSYMIIWKRAYITAFFIAIVLTLFTRGSLTHFSFFFSIFIISYIGIMTMLNWNCAHTVEPINRLVIEYMTKQNDAAENMTNKITTLQKHKAMLLKKYKSLTDTATSKQPVKT